MVAGSLLLVGCGGGGGRYAAEVARQARNVDEWLRLIKQSEKLAHGARATGNISEAAQHSDRAAWAAQQVDAAVQQAMQAQPSGQLPDETLRLLRELEEARVEARSMALRTQSDNAVAAALNGIKSEPRLLADEHSAVLEGLVRDFLCLHFEEIAMEGEMPAESDYLKFLRDKGIEHIVPAWELKGKVESVINFAQSASQARTPTEARVYARLLRECIK